MITVTGASVVRGGTATRLSGHIGDTELYWELPTGWEVELRGEPFAAVLLPVAMGRGAALVIPPELPIDPIFADHLTTLQEVFDRWFPGLTRVPVEATLAPRARPTRLAATGYSGGVDSSYTVDRLSPDLDAVLLIDGIEYAGDEAALFSRVESTLTTALARHDLELVRLRTNAKQAGRALGANWHQAIGGVLASCAHAAGFRRYVIAASNSWENLAPYGTHPVTDPLWSSGDVAIDHHGAELRRIDKTRWLGDVPPLLDSLRVCFQGGQYNCGTCEKCLRTMAGLRALGLRSAAVPPLVDPRDLRHLVIGDEFALVDWEEILLDGLRERDRPLHAELTRLVRRFRWRQVIKELDALTMGGGIRRAAHRLRAMGR